MLRDNPPAPVPILGREYFPSLTLLTLLVAVLQAGLSLGGLAAQSTFYPTEELRRAFLSNDVVNLFIGLPILLGSLLLARRGRLAGLLFWPGAFFFITYNATAYAIALYGTFLFVPNLALVLLSIGGVILLLAGIDAPAVRQQLSGFVREKLTGGFLAGFGILFFLLAASKVLGALNGQAPLSRPDMAMQLTDLLITPAWIAGGVFLWRKAAPGYVAGAGLLFQASMLFIGLLVFLS